MASCDPFDVEFSGSADQLFAKISALVHDNDGTITGGPSGGAVSVPSPVGKIEAKYSVAGQTATIHVTKRPFFLPCSTIEKFLKSNVPTVEATEMAQL